jgi:S-adenosyl-L-methionine hydrolase (adenosine-forming)
LAHRPIITLTTDFGLHDHFVGTVKGVILNILPEVEIVDICHSVTPFDLLEGALTIAAAYSYFPAGTVHLVVVDPGVGTSRRAIVATTARYEFVAPDNGVLSMVYRREERLVVHSVSAEHYFLQPVSATFQARDIFAPVAAYLAKGVAPAKFGDEIADFVRLDLPRPQRLGESTLRGQVLKVDHFGNLVTNIAPQDAPILTQPQASALKILVGGRAIAGVKRAYSEGDLEEVFAILGSMGYLEIAAKQASAAKILAVGKGSNVDLVIEAPIAASANPGRV